MLTANNLATVVSQIRARHRRRRFAMKTQQKLDRSLESFVRRNYTEWHPDLPEKEREAINKLVKAKIKESRGKADDLGNTIDAVDKGRLAFDALREDAEREMEQLAKQLPIYPWVEAIPGAGALGLATVIAETGDLSNYSNVAKVWKRLGFAPYQGLAGSTWKRESWRDRALTKEEWIANPFSGERYGFMAQIAQWIWVAQWISKGKRVAIEAALKERPHALDIEIAKAVISDEIKRMDVKTVTTVRDYLANLGEKGDDGEGVPNGEYGRIYAEKRAAKKDLDGWPPMRVQKHALRLMFKEFTKQLFLEWRRLFEDASDTDQTTRPMKPIAQLSDQSRPATIALKPNDETPAATLSDAEQTSDGLKPTKPLSARKRPAKIGVKPTNGLPAAPIQESSSTIGGLKPRTRVSSTRRSAKALLKPSRRVPAAEQSE